MAWSALVPSAPPDYQAMLDDQNARWISNNYGAGLGAYSNWNAQPQEEEFDWDSLTKGNMFFTGNNVPQRSALHTNNSLRPFLWNGKNKSLQKAYKTTYDAYAAQVPNQQSSFYETWKGPDIRPTYSASNGLSTIGTPSYWQDNNNNQLFEAKIDDYLPEMAANQAVTQETAAPQPAAITTATTTPTATTAPDWMDQFMNSLPFGG